MGEKPHSCPVSDVQQLLVIKEEKDQDAPHIKEEEEEVLTSQGEEQLKGLEEADVNKFTFSPVPVKTEDDDNEEPQFSPLHQSQTEETRDSDRGPRPDSDSGPVIVDKTSDMFVAEIEVSCEDWEESTEPEKPLQCPVCKKTFANAGFLETHMKTHAGEKPFSCSFCEKGFGQMGNLAHQVHAPLEEKRFLYCVCGKRFVWRDGTESSQMHQSLASGGKLYGCSVCMKFFSSTSSIRKHLRIHTGEKPFGCSVCGKRFTEKGNLVSHMACHTGEKRFTCNICDKKFIWRSVFKKHRCVDETAESVSETRSEREDRRSPAPGPDSDLHEYAEPRSEFKTVGLVVAENNDSVGTKTMGPESSPSGDDVKAKKKRYSLSVSEKTFL